MIAKRKPGAAMHGVRRAGAAGDHGEDVRRGLTLAQVLEDQCAGAPVCWRIALQRRGRCATFRSRQRGSALAPQTRRPQLTQPRRPQLTQPSMTPPAVERSTVRVPSQTWQRSGGDLGRPGFVATAWRRALAVAPCSAEALAMSLAALCSVVAARDGCQGRLLGTTARGLRQAVPMEHSAARLELSATDLSRV